MRRIWAAAISGVVALALTPMSSAPASPSTPLSRRPFTVVAVVDSGIDPYHRDFRRPELNLHPSTYIEGFPHSASSLDLEFGAPTYAKAFKADRQEWKKIKDNRLYWLPGTNIIGAIGPFDSTHIADQDPRFSSDGDPPREPPFYDDRFLGHGTAVASLAAGSIHGPDSDDVLIVALKGFEDAVKWAAKQPWIDVITASWWHLGGSLDLKAVAAASRIAVEDGKVVCFASGNFAHPQLYSSAQGPSWNVNIGAASARTRGEHSYTNYPNDVLGLSGVSAAAVRTFDGKVEFGGTSAAAPNVCGLIAKTISEVREEAGYFREGTSRRALVYGQGDGALSDGRLTSDELEDAIQATAVPAEPSPPDPDDQYSMPASPVAPFVRGGYGIVDGDSAVDALKLLLGLAERPDRSLEDAWISTTDSIRDAIWGPRP